MLTENLVSDKPPLRSLLNILINVFLAFFIIAPVLGLAISSLFYDGDLLRDFQNPGQNPAVIGPVLLTKSIATLIGLIVYPAIHIIIIERKHLSSFFPRQQKTFLIFFLTAFLGLTFIIAISPVVEWNMALKFPEFMKDFETWARQEEGRLAKLIEAMTNFTSIGDLFIGLFVVALLPAIGEELVFRGMIQNEFFRSTNNAHLSIWISAGIFSAIHFQFYGFIPRVLSGALFGYLYYWSGNLLIPMFAHFFNNAIGVIMIYLSYQKIIDSNIKDTVSFRTPFVILSLVLTVGLLYYIWKHYNNGLPKHASDSPGT